MTDITEKALSSDSSGADPAEPDIAGQVQHAVDAALDLKAVNLKVLRLEDVTDFTDYFLVMSGTSDRQVKAIADAVEERLRKQGRKPLHVEGLSQALWVLLDYGDFVIHIFDEERRDFYALERLWGDAPVVTDTFVAAHNAGGSGNGQGPHSASGRP